MPKPTPEELILQAVGSVDASREYPEPTEEEPETSGRIRSIGGDERGWHHICGPEDI